LPHSEIENKRRFAEVDTDDTFALAEKIKI